MIIRGAGLSLFWRLFGYFSGYALSLLITNWLGAEAFGLYSLFLSLLALFSIPVKVGLDRALIRLLSEEVYHVRKLLLKALFILIPIGIAGAFVIYLLSETLAVNLYNSPELTQVFEMVAIAVIPFSLLLVGSESFRGLGKAGAYAFCQHALRQFLPLLLLSFAYLFAFGGGSELLPIKAFLIGVSLAVFVTIFLLYRISQEPSTIKTTVPGTSAILSLGFPVMLASSAAIISATADTLMLRIFEDDATVGKYNGALKLSMLMSFAISSITTLAAKQFSKFYHDGEMDKFRKSVQFVSRLIFISSLPVLIVLLLFPEPLLGFFGEDFTEAKPALYILLIGYAFNAISGPVDLVLQMTGRQSAYQWMVLCTTIANIALNALLIPLYGMEGAAIATAFSLVATNLIALVYCRKVFGFWTNSILPLKSASND